MGKIEKERRKKEFDRWITFIPDKINELKIHLPEKISSLLDYSVSSLDAIESYLIKTYSFDDLTSNDNKSLVDCLAAYVGTTFKNHWEQSYWDIELDNKKELYYGVPILKFKDKPLPPVSPYHTITTVADRKKGDMMSLILKRTQERLKQC